MIAQACREKLINFSIGTNEKYKPAWFHQDIANKLEAVENGEIKRLIIQMPPRHGKSQLASINFPAWFLGRNPDKEIITASYSSELAIDFGSKTRDLINTPQYQYIFPNVHLREDEKSKAKWRTNKSGSYISVGVGGPITGRGANIFVIDDPIKNKEEADSEVIRNKIWDWYTSTAYTRLEKGGVMIVIMTRWHLDDLVGRLLQAEKEGGEHWELINFPAINEEGKALWPEKYPIAELENIKQTIGGYDWASLYMQNPILSEQQEFKPEWIRSRDIDTVDQLQTRNFLTIDTAISAKASADNTGICRNYVDRENNWNLWAYKMRLNPAELINLMFTLHDEDGYEQIGIEKTVYFDVFKYLLEEEFKKRNRYLPIVPLEHKQIAKETRIRGLIPRYEYRSVYHLKDKCKDLEEEMFNFPKGAHDDVLDATAYQIQIAEAPSNPETTTARIQQNRQDYRYKE